MRKPRLVVHYIMGKKPKNAIKVSPKKLDMIYENDPMLQFIVNEAKRKGIPEKEGFYYTKSSLKFIESEVGPKEFRKIRKRIKTVKRPSSNDYVFFIDPLTETLYLRLPKRKFWYW